ncbi:MAG TPA: hypothetical protein VH619_15245, partial [Verrucomicrobiae bacterium]|nr:hypothetical protein [Verrucomicrobiae bacterium]
MKLKMTVLALMAGSIMTPVFAQSGIQLVVTGSTAFRPVDEDRITNLFGPGYSSTILSGNNYGAWSGTMKTAIPSLGTNTVTIYASFSGSATGMKAVQYQTPVPIVLPGGTNTSTSLTPDLAFSDMFAGGASPPIQPSVFASNAILGVLPFAWVRANNPLLEGITNLTRDQALLLEVAGGLMPASYLGGTVTNSTNVVYFTGRSTGSGTRITTEKDIGFVGSANLYQNLGGSAGWQQFAGYSSSSGVDGSIATNANVISYLGLPDVESVLLPTNGCVVLAYDGVPYNTTNVENGSYGVWGYEHLCTRFGLSASQTAIRDALIQTITNPNYQNTNVVFTGNYFIPLENMQVQRGSDG